MSLASFTMGVNYLKGLRHLGTEHCSRERLIMGMYVCILNVIEFISKNKGFVPRRFHNDTI